MGSSSIWHWLIILFVLGSMMLLVVGAIVWMVRASARRGGTTGNTGTRTAAERLAELGSLRARNLITEAEYSERRKAILGEV
jgi:hypothetical protein